MGAGALPGEALEAIAAWLEEAAGNLRSHAKLWGDAPGEPHQ